MDNQEKIDNLITVVKTFARKFASIEEKIDTIEVKLDKFRVGIKEGILDRLDKVEKTLKWYENEDAKALVKQSTPSDLEFIKLPKRETTKEAKQISRREFLGLSKPHTDKEVKPAMYNRITANLQELMCLFNQEDEWEVNFIQGILDFSGQTVTQKQYEVLKQLAARVEYDQELVIER
jgi:hypothetical protein